MKRDPWQELWWNLAIHNPRACLLDPRHPVTLACVIAAMVATAAAQLMASG